MTALDPCKACGTQVAEWWHWCGLCDGWVCGECFWAPGHVCDVGEPPVICTSCGDAEALPGGALCAGCQAAADEGPATALVGEDEDRIDWGDA